MSTITETRIKFGTRIKQPDGKQQENGLPINGSIFKNDSIDIKNAQHDTTTNLIEQIGTDPNYKRVIVWTNVYLYLFVHFLALYGVFLAITTRPWLAIMFHFTISAINGQGVTLGAHRLYSHKAFKASYFLRIIVIFLHTACGQNTVFTWVRDHRLHHKYSDTDADPHNSERGFFFSHMGWLLSKKHPLVIEKGRKIDMSDILADPIVMFQKRYYIPMYAFTTFLHLAIPMYFWNESLKNAFFICYLTPTIYMLHATWTVNSIAHFFGTKPFDKTLRPVESLVVSFLTNGEGWHNYHHCFPRDYRASEFGAKCNYTSKIIEIFAFLGLAADLRTAPDSSVRHKAIKHGDGSHPVFGNIEYDPKRMTHLTQDFVSLTKQENI